MKNDAIIDSILSLLTEYKKVLASPKPKKEDANGLRYLLGQIIRQYDIPQSNLHLSVAAFNRWKELSSKCIANYHYRDTVKCDHLKGPKSFILYKGAYGTGTSTVFTPNFTFIFRQMFHEDHVIPVSMIIDKLSQAQMINRSAIKSILDDMHICVILKEEDRKIGRTNGRSLDFATTIKTVYEPAQIELYPQPYPWMNP